MPFVTLEQITPLIPNGIAVVLGRDDNFETIESDAAIEIRDLAGIEIPSAVDDAPDWIRIPAARIIAKLALRLVSNWSPETVASIDNDYKIARDDLRRRRTTASTIAPKKSSVGTFEGEETW